MGTRRNVIMLNGNRYDASTGELLNGTTTKPVQTRQKNSVNIDGFVNKNTPVSPRKPHTISRQSLKSKTLMRTAVKKPVLAKKTSSPQPTITKSSQRVDPLRQTRAKTTGRSSLISKFGSEVKRITKYSPLPIASPPPTELISKPKKDANLKPVTINSAPRQPNQFERAMNSSTSHTKHKTKKVTRRHKVAKKLRISPSLLNVSMVLMTGILLGGYFAYNNVPNLAMRVASARSGIPGSVPAYKPSGFALSGPIQYRPGQITISFKSNTDNRNYTVAQRNSDWNSEALLDNHVASNQRQYQTFQDKGKTIYIYDGDSASWVDKGVWYEIDGNTSLNTDQVLRIASSL